MKKSRIIGVLFGSLFIISMLTFILTGSDSIFGYTVRIVISGSMEPTIPVYTVNIVKKCSISDIKKGDIILYNYKSDIIHRVIDINTDGSLITQGDANEVPDEISVSADMFIGKVTKTLYWTRHILTLVKGGSRRAIQIGIVICIMFLYLLYIVIKRYAKIYYIYLHIDKDIECIKSKNIKKIYADMRDRWRKAEIEYHRNSAEYKENTAENDNKH